MGARGRRTAGWRRIAFVNRSRHCWTLVVWRLLCLLTGMSVCAAVTGAMWTWPPIVQGIALAPGLVVTLLIVVASWADS